MEKGITTDTNAEMWTGSVMEREVEGWRKECLDYTETDGGLDMKTETFLFFFFFFQNICLV